MPKTEHIADQIAEAIPSFRPSTPLLNAAGRALMVVAQSRAGVTLNSLAQSLGVTHWGASKTISSLVGAQLVTRTKVKSQDMYHLNPKALLEHPDITGMALLHGMAQILQGVNGDDIIPKT